MAGAHLDSVNAGPGINDNGSGSAALLEVAEQLAKVNPVNTVRFAWWGAEESDPRRLDALRHRPDRGASAAGSRSTSTSTWSARRTPSTSSTTATTPTPPAPGPGPSGSARIEKTFEAFYSQRQLPFKGTDFSGRSDYGPFIAAGIPSGGLFTGAEGVKTAAGGGASGAARRGSPTTPATTRPATPSPTSTCGPSTSTATRWASPILQYAMNTFDINGIPGKDNFPPVDPTAALTSRPDGRVAGLQPLTGGGAEAARSRYPLVTGPMSHVGQVRLISPDPRPVVRLRFVATTTAPSRPASARRTTIALKVLMAGTGLVFVGFVLLHMYGNLKALCGRGGVQHLRRAPAHLR